MMIYHFLGQNENFAQKAKNLVIWCIILKQIKYLWYNDSFGLKISCMTKPSDVNWNFQKLN